MRRFSGKVAIVTGAAQGIGLACAKRFLSEGAYVLIADINRELGERAVSTLGQHVRFIPCDVSSNEQLLHLVERATAEFTGDIDIVVNNAAIHECAGPLEYSEEMFVRTLRVNLLGVFLLSQIAAKKMIDQVKDGKRPGTIVNIASINSIVSMPHSAAYSASKGGLLQLTKSLALAFSSYGIRVNAVGPGSITTPANTEPAEGVVLRTPLRRSGTPDEIASVVAFLASKDASYITGEIIYADGGRLALDMTTADDGLK